MSGNLDVPGVRSFSRFLFNPLIVIASAGFLAFFWFRSMAIEPFDFDESVYRQMAEEMKRAGGWLSQPVFNGEPYNHKPPPYIGILASFSQLADGPAPQVTSFAGRTVSILFSVLTAFLLHQTWRMLLGKSEGERFEQRRTFEFAVSPVFFLLMTFLPTVASSAILLDPMLVFFTSVFVCAEAVRIGKTQLNQRTRFLLFVMSVVGMAGATITKGLIGLVLPAGSVLVYVSLAHLSLLKVNKWSFVKEFFQTGLRRFFPAWLCAAGVSAGFYLYLWNSGGSAFVHEFFIRHHFGRATSPMEGHSGSLFYYVPILVLGGGYILSWLGYLYVMSSMRARNNIDSVHLQTSQQTPSVQRIALQKWLLSWCLFCVAFFSLLATKLPNYIWPIWPILALWAALSGTELKKSFHLQIERMIRFFARWFAFVLPVALLLASLVLASWESVLYPFFPLKEREEAVLLSVLQHKWSVAGGFFLAGALLLMGAIVLRSWGERSILRRRESALLSGGVARWLALIQVSACSILMILAVPAAEEVMTLSVQQSTARAKMFLGVGDKLATSDLYSPNVVSSHGEPVVFGIGDSEYVFNDKRINVILTPVWNIGLCRRYGYDIVQGTEYLRVCLRSYRRTLEGPGH